jgi:hypothetical protein
VGRRQRHSEFVGLTDAEVRALARDPTLPAAVRREAQAEEKYRKQATDGDGRAAEIR